MHLSQNNQYISKMSILDYTSPFEGQKKFGEFFKRERLKRDWSRATLSEKCSVPISSINRFESLGEISLSSLFKIADAMEITDKLLKITEGEVLPQTLEEMKEFTKTKNRKRGK
jgi:transcriptional regulator with XRE-family HTH domain